MRIVVFSIVTAATFVICQAAFAQSTDGAAAAPGTSSSMSGTSTGSPAMEPGAEKTTPSANSKGATGGVGGKGNSGMNGVGVGGKSNSNNGG